MTIVLSIYASILALAVWQEKRGTEDFNRADEDC